MQPDFFFFLSSCELRSVHREVCFAHQVAYKAAWVLSMTLDPGRWRVGQHGADLAPVPIGRKVSPRASLEAPGP